MSYEFQVDLLDDGVLDYSEQELSTLNENGLPAGLTTTDGRALAYSTTKWYSPVPPGGVGSPAKSHCDGTPLSPNTDPDPTMYLVEGAANPITPASAWVSGSDVNFDGTISAALRGYDDWANLDLRQIGATGSEIYGGGKLTVGTGKLTVGTGKLTVGAGKLTVGTGVGELTFETANSSVRSPRNLTATQTTPPHYITLNWFAPTFGQIGSYNIYRSTNGATAVLISSVLGTSLTFTDTSVTCGPTYSYFVTAVLANTNPPQESVPSNVTSAIPTCTPTSTTVTSSVNPSIFGQSVTFTATVANTSGGTPTPTGSVQFSVDGAPFGAAVPLSGSGTAVTAASGATATLTVSGSPHIIRAVYTSTGGSFSGSSGTLSQTVNPAPTSTTVTSSVNPSIYGQSVTFTVTVANIAGAGISTARPTGSVQFMDGSSLLGTPQTVSGLGAATLTTGALTVGTHPITAVYTNIDGNFKSSASSSLTQVVEDFSIIATPTAQTIPSGHQAIYSVTVTPIGGLAGTIALSCSGAPPNSTCSVSPSTDNLQGTALTSTVTLFANKNVNHGTFTLTFTGAIVGGNLTHSTTVQLTVK
jgi:X-X-X-Leu-X-X-Gly heptad repeat protein